MDEPAVHGSLPRPTRLRPGEEFVSEAIVPEPGTFDAAAMARGEPGLPGAFTWRGRRYVVIKLVAGWKKTGTDRGEVYLRRHYYDVETATGERMTLYCERQTKDRKKPKARWWLYTVRGSAASSRPDG